jgi:hypothetical protein
MVIVALAIGLRSRFEWRPGDPWKVAALSGTPRIDGAGILSSGNARLAVGQVLETDSTARAQVRIGGIGVMEVEPGSRVKLLDTRARHHRVALEYGAISAHTWAPPFSFGIATPSSQAMDMGCAFELRVNADGYGLLRVTSGWVALELDDLQSMIPAGAEAATRPGLGPGTAYFSDARPQFKEALATFDTSPADSAARAQAVDAILAGARFHDALTLLNLLHKVPLAERERLLDRLSQFVPIPDGYSREDILELHMDALNQYWPRVNRALGLGDSKSWIVNWRDALGR